MKTRDQKQLYSKNKNARSEPEPDKHEYRSVLILTPVPRIKVGF